MEIEPSLSSLIHQKLSKELKKKIYFYEGSPFVYDYSNEYQYQMIKKIKEHANNGDIIILQNLNQIYAFLYDLFNKNFTLKDGKNYARICHGNYTDQYFPVNNEFRVIVMVNKQYLDKVEPPFLNRFEKIIISFDKLINENKPSDILGQLDDFYYNEKCYYSLKDLLGCSEEDVFGMIYYELNTNENQKQNIDKKNIFNKIYKLLPQDIIVNLDNDNELKQMYYSKKIYYNLEDYLNSEPRHKISIIYTFHSLTGVVNGINESSSFKMISEIKSELQLDSIINTMISDKEKDNIKTKNPYKNYIFIHFDESNSKKIGFLVSFFINNYSDNRELKFIFIVHIKRHFVNKSKIYDKIYAILDINSDVYQLFIDNLNGPIIKLDELLANPVQVLIKYKIIKFEELFKKVLRQFTNENLKQFIGKNSTIDNENYSEKLEKFFDDNKNFRNKIIEKVKLFIFEQKFNSNIIDEVYKLRYINENSIDLVSSIIDYIKNKIISVYFLRILNEFEDNNILTSSLVISNERDIFNEDIQNIINDINIKYLDMIKLEEDKSNPKFNLNFIIPGFYNFYIKLSDFIGRNITKEYFKYEKK